MANYLGLRNKFLPNLRQYEATTGRPIADRTMQNYLYSALQTEADRADQRFERDRQYGLQREALNLQQKQVADASKAANISGFTQLAGLPFQGYLGYKMLQKSGLIGGGSAVPAAATAQGAIAPVLGTAQESTASVLSAPSSFAPQAAATEATLAAPSAGGGAAAATPALAYAAPAAAGFLGGKFLAEPLDKILPGGGKTGKAVGGAAGGAITGAIAGSFFPGVGTLVGGIIGGIGGFISSLF